MIESLDEGKRKANVSQNSRGIGGLYGHCLCSKCGELLGTSRWTYRTHHWDMVRTTTIIHIVVAMQRS